MTWLPVTTNGQTERDAVLGLAPEPYAATRSALLAAWRMTDPALLERCRVRLAQLTEARAELEGVDDALLADLDDPEASSRFTDRERAALAFAAQYHYDHHGLGDDQRAALAEQLSEREVIDFVWALQVNDAYLRLVSLLDLAPDPPGSPARPERTPPDGPARGRDAEPATPAGARARELRDPGFTAAYEVLGRTVVRQNRIDAATSEAIRLRNASHQGCVY